MEIVNGVQGIQLLKEEMTLVHKKDRTIVKYHDGKIILHHDKWHSSISEEDFLELYYESEFIVYEAQEQTIDEKKDEEYYQWAANHQ